MKVGDKIEIDGRMGTIATRAAARSGLVLIVFDDGTTFFNSFLFIDRSVANKRMKQKRDSGTVKMAASGGQRT